MIKKVLFAILLAQSLTVGAQEKKSWISNVKLSGYGMVQYQYNGNESTASDEHGTNKSNSFNLRLARFTLDGRILEDLYWKEQPEFLKENLLLPLHRRYGHNPSLQSLLQKDLQRRKVFLA